MLAVSKILTGVAGLALVAVAAAPAAAQSYPYGYPQSGNVVGQVINQVLGGGAYGNQAYGQYGQGNSRVAVDQCARAAMARVSGNGYGYNQGYNRAYGYGYNGYNNAGAARVVAITRVEQRSNGLRVRGVIDAGGGYGNQGYGYGNYGYNNRGNTQQLDFKCTVDYRGYVRDVDLDRRSTYYRGY